MHGRFIRPDTIGPGEGLVIGLFVLLVVALLVVGAILVTRTIVHRGVSGGGVSASGPLRILEERFARGEIDEEEFKRRRDLLRS